MSIDFVGCGGSLRVRISANSLRTFDVHRQRRFWNTERGGVLFASTVGAEDGQVEVSVATPPHRSDRAGRTWLQLDHARCLREIRAHFAKGLHFVGYWHTHPEPDPHLSTQDERSFRALVGSSGIDLGRLLLVVVGNDSRFAPSVSVLHLQTGVFERLERPAVNDSGRRREERDD